MSVNDKDILDSFFNQYDEAAKKSTNGSGSKTKEFDLKNYFNVILNKGETEREFTIRILPPNDNKSPFKEVFLHADQINGDWKKFYCLKHNKKEDCPYCEAFYALRKKEGKTESQVEEDKEIAKKYRPRKFYWVKVIDRSKENDGPKFWRFPHNFKGSGILDKIKPLMSKYGNITNPETGRDITIVAGHDDRKNVVVKSILIEEPSKLSDDPDKSKNWIENTKAYEDVYGIKTYDYLAILVKGGEPMWDKDLGKFVDKNKSDSSEVESLEKELDATNTEALDDSDDHEDNEAHVQHEVTTTTTVEDINLDDEDDLPF